ncbi:MAG: T9SS type A sorting domain-containing protein, partial [Bacteroidales bacterium]|nr:T9SS type A sorting domain-containing protein [Bacteroidales bacterium]
TVTADAKTKTYGDSDPTLTYTVNPALIAGDNFVGTLIRVAGENVGTYAINQGTLSAGSNYTITYDDDTLTITPAPQTLTIYSDTTIYVEDGSITLHASTTSGLPVTFNIDNLTSAMLAGDVLTPLQSGLVIVTASVAHNDNYQDVAPVTQNITILSNNTNNESVVSNATEIDEAYYVLDCGENSVTVNVTVEDSGAKVFYNNIESNTFTVNIPKADIYSVNYTVKSSSGIEKVYTVTIERYFVFEEIGSQKFNNLVYVNNNPAGNGGYKFTGYQWYKDGIAIAGATSQYYSAGENSSDVLDTNAVYSVILVTEDGKTLHTCTYSPVIQPLPMKVYPNPAPANRTATAEIYSDAQYIEMFDMAGKRVGTYLRTGTVTNIPTPSLSGSYILRAGSEQTKFIVK